MNQISANILSDAADKFWRNQYIKLAIEPDETSGDTLNDIYGKFNEDKYFPALEDRTGETAANLTLKDFEGILVPEELIQTLADNIIQRSDIFYVIKFAKTFKGHFDSKSLEHKIYAQADADQIWDYLGSMEEVKKFITNLPGPQTYISILEKFSEIIQKHGSEQDGLFFQKHLLQIRNPYFLSFTYKTYPKSDVNLILEYLQAAYQYINSDFDFIVKNLVLNLGFIPLNIKQWLLEDKPSYYIEACDEIENLDILNINDLVIACAQTNDNYTIKEICHKHVFGLNQQLILEYLLHNKTPEYILSILEEFHNYSPDGIIMKNFPALQAIIEKNGDNETLRKLLEQNFKVNFAPFKQAFNAKIAKQIKAGDIEEKEFVRYVENRPDRYESSLRTIINQQERLRKLVDIFSKDWTTVIVSEREEVKQLFEFLLKRKDYIYLTPELSKKMLCPFAIIYKRLKNKTFVDLWHEVYKNDYTNLSKCYLAEKNLFLGRDEFYKLQYVLHKCVAISTNFAEYVKFLEKIVAAGEILHNSGVHKDILEKAILNKSFDLGDATNEELLEVINGVQEIDEGDEEDIYKMLVGQEQIEKLLWDVDQLNEQSGKEYINISRLRDNLIIFKSIFDKFDVGQPISWRRGSAEYEAVKQLHSDISFINDFETIQEYLHKAQPKDPRVMQFSLSFPDGFEFEVLKYQDPLAFRIGVITDCCQRIGGVGEDAAIDSFINPFASVLLLKKDGHIIAQSYFHYVPNVNYEQEQKGIGGGLILDNIEWNEKVARAIHINPSMLSKIYAEYAAAIKAKYPGLAYIKCGKGYSKIDNALFENGKMQADPRHFESDEQYTDFDKNDHLDLLQPKEQIKNVQVKMAKVFIWPSYNLIKICDVRRWAMRKVISV